MRLRILRGDSLLLRLHLLFEVYDERKNENTRADADEGVCPIEYGEVDESEVDEVDDITE